MTASVVDVKTHKEIAMLKDEFGRPIPHTEKILYLGFKDGKLVEGNNQFAVGDSAAYRARMGAGTSSHEITGSRQANEPVKDKTDGLGGCDSPPPGVGRGKPRC